MKKLLVIISLGLSTTFYLNSQTTTFDNLNANPLTSKAITWTSSNFGSGFGHRIINSDPGGQTLLNFQGRNNTTTWSNIMSLSSNGNIGIGTSNSSSRLTVNTGVTQLNMHGDGGVYGYNVNVNTSGGWARNYSFSSNGIARAHMGALGDNNSLTYLYFDTNATDAIGYQTPEMVIKPNGNVGIGTTNPAAKFNSYESTALGNASGDFQILSRISGKSGSVIMQNNWLLRDESASSNWLTARYHNGLSVDSSFLTPGIDTRTWWERDIYAGNQFWGNSSETQMSLVSGNLGIGTSTPDSKLTVKGNIHSNEVKVDLLGAIAPDYVFYKDYDLKTLQEVEAYILNNGHLANIPSAEEMGEEGINLKEMNLKLLEKIEELTLYTIAQEKRIQTLEGENKTIKSQEDRIKLLEEKMLLLLTKKQ